MLRALLPLALVACGGAHQSPAPRFAVTLSAEGVVEVAPDEATLSFQLSCEKQGARAASACLREKATALHALLAGIGVDSADRQTLDLRLDKRYRWTGQESVFAGYTAATSLRVTLRDVALLPRVYDELLEDTDLTLGGLTYGHSAIDSLSRRAHVLAVAETAALAEALLPQLGAASVRLVGLSNAPGQRPRTDLLHQAEYRAVEVSAQSAEAAPSFASSPGMIRVTTRVWAEYVAGDTPTDRG